MHAFGNFDQDSNEENLKIFLVAFQQNKGAIQQLLKQQHATSTYAVQLPSHEDEQEHLDKLEKLQTKFKEEQNTLEQQLLSEKMFMDTRPKVSSLMHADSIKEPVVYKVESPKITRAKVKSKSVPRSSIASSSDQSNVESMDSVVPRSISRAGNASRIKEITDCMNVVETNIVSLVQLYEQESNDKMKQFAIQKVLSFVFTV